MIEFSTNSGGDNSSGSMGQRQINSMKRKMVFESVRLKRQLIIETADGISVETFSHWVDRVTFATEFGKEITLPSITKMDLYDEAT
tara:strand:- start:31 stop:288 length:258 start_codon:yes stop_codon:yes gene_type:complete